MEERPIESTLDLSAQQLDYIARTVPGGKSNIEQIYPLAPLQEGMLFHHMLGHNADPYIVTTLLEFQTRAHLDAFCAGLQKVIDRHDTLRTAVLWDQLPRPVQVVYRVAPLPVDKLVLDPGEDPVEQLRNRLRPDRQTLNLHRAPLLDLQVTSDPRDERWYALFRVHHLVCDGMSHDIVVAEITSHLQGTEDRLPTPAPYRDYVLRALARSSLPNAKQFFTAKLAEVDEPTAPFGLLDIKGDGSRLLECRRVLEAEVAGRARAEARRTRISLAALLHAAWALVVARTSCRDEVVFGTVLLGRLQMSAASTRGVGMFLNTLPLRLSVHDIDARELVLRTQRELLELLTHEHASLALAQRCSKVAPPAPLFTSLLNYRRRKLSADDQWHTPVSGIRVLDGRVWNNYPLTLLVDDNDTEVVLTIQVDGRLDPRRVVDYMHAALISLLVALESFPSRPVSDLSVLPELERRQILEGFNPTSPVGPAVDLIHELFESQAHKTPNAPAVVCEGQMLTYAELNSKANRLARYLRRRGIGPDQLVAVYLRRGPDLAVGILGIIKAGGAYLPLDTDYPIERLQAILLDASPGVLLVEKSLQETLPVQHASIVSMDGDWEAMATEQPDNLDRRVTGACSHSLVYVIYTSGSTGTPKGVMISHRNLVASTLARQHFYGDAGRFLLLSSIAFDSSVAGIFGTLCTGGTLLVGSREAMRDPLILMDTIESLRANTILCVPSLYLELLAGPGGRLRASALNCVIVAGETCPPGLVGTSLQHAPAVRLCNEYGPTEATVWCTVYECHESDLSCPIPIGRPTANARIYILDQRMRPVPLNVIGELYIGGTSVAGGYLNQPDLTAARFVQDPFGAEPGARLYRTGDLGRWRADGNIEFFGRTDRQVKIRGFRIELGEVEAQIARDSRVKEVAVVAREDTPGDHRLVAYLALEAEPATPGATIEELRAQLASALPRHMIPSAFVSMQRLPLTPNGKIDRLALPPPDVQAYGSTRYEPPQGEDETLVAQIWQTVLRIPRVGRNDNFFQLGGHSLLAMQAVTRIRSAFCAELPISVLFDSPTLHELAEIAATHRRAALRRQLAGAGTDIKDLLAQIAAMPDSKARELVKALQEGASK